MMKYALLIACLVLTGCASQPPPQTLWCRNLAPAQAAEWVRANGKDTAKLIMLETPSWTTTHMQAQVLWRGEWWYVVNRPVTFYLSKDPQFGCVPIYEVDFWKWMNILMRVYEK